MTTLDKREQYLSDVLTAFKEGDMSMAEVLKAIRKRKPNQAKIDGAKDFAKLIAEGNVEEAFSRYRFGLKNVRTRRRRSTSTNGKSA